MSEKDKKVCRSSNYFEHFLVFISAVSDCVSICVFASLIEVSVGIASLAVRLPITAAIRKYKSIIKKKGKSMIK